MGEVSEPPRGRFHEANSMSTPPRKVRPGEAISAAWANKLVDQANRDLKGPGVTQTSTGHQIRKRPINRPSWGFVVGLLPDHEGEPKVLVRDAQYKYIPHRQWYIDEDSNNQGMRFLKMVPGYTLADYRSAVIKHQQSGDIYAIGSSPVQGQPDESDVAVMILRDLAVPLVAAKSPPGFTRCRVAEVDPVDQRALVLPLTAGAGFQPSDAEQWLDDANFGLRICVWTQGLTHARKNNPCVVFGGSGVGWMSAALNWVGVDYSRSCEPVGRLTPSVDHSCETPPTPLAFAEKFACITDQGCERLTLCDCILKNGTVPIDSATGDYLVECPDA